MWGKFIPCFLLTSLPLFARENPQKEHICKASLHAMARFELQYIPRDTQSCNADDECTYLVRVPWIRAVGFTKVALAGYHMMLEDPNYRRVYLKSKANCNQRHPQMVLPLPCASQCINSKCTAIFEEDEHRR